MHQAGAGGFFTDALEGEAEGENTVGARIGYGGTGVRVRIEVGGKGSGGGRQTFGRGHGVGLGIGMAGDAETQAGAVDLIGGRMAQAAPVGIMKDIAQERFACHAASGVGAAHEEVSARFAIGGECPFGGGTEGTVFGTADKVDDGVRTEVGRAAFEGLGTARHERPASRLLDGFAVDEGIVEGVSGDALAFQFASAIAQSAFGLDAGARAVEALLISAEGGGADIRYAGVCRDVEALAGGGLYGSGRGGAAESVHDEHGAAAMGGTVCREGFGREALAAPVDRRDAEAVDDARFGFEGIAGLAHVGTVIESASPHTGIDHVAFRACGRFERVFGGSPAQLEGVPLLALVAYRPSGLR